MNRKQRDKNRATALALHYACPPKHACPECGELTHHGHFFPPCFGDEGFWTCSKFYGEDGRRLVVDRRAAHPEVAIAYLALCAESPAQPTDAAGPAAQA